MAEGASFGRLIKARRRALDLTQEALARRVAYSVITIRKVEADERRPSRQLAEALAVGLAIPAEERPAFVALARAAPAPPVAGPGPSSTVPGLTTPSLTTPRRAAPGHPAPDQPAPGHPANGRPATNLPAPLTRLIGRDDECAAVRDILLRDAVRLVTLVGPPGIGKSRL